MTDQGPNQPLSSGDTQHPLTPPQIAAEHQTGSLSVPSVVLMMVDTGNTEGEAASSVAYVTPASVSHSAAPQPELPPVHSSGAITLTEMSPDAAFVSKRAALCSYGSHNIVLNAPVTFNINIGGSNQALTAPINIFGLKSDCSVNNISSSGAYAVMSGSKPSVFAPNSGQ